MKRVKVTMGQRQAEALLDAALMGIEDLHDYTDDPEYRAKARYAERAADLLAAAIGRAKA
jgi:hypothetical protein